MRLLLRVAAFLGKFLVGTALALAVFLAGTYFHVRGALPSYSGKLEAAGLKAPVEILRDKNAVPHIIAGSIEDASFALGYVHAQDRFWQMELMRRIGQGRLAELVPPRLIGSGLVDSDRTMRGLGVYRRASESVNALSPAMRARLDAYAAGVNAWLADDDQQFGLELTLIKLLSGGRYRPEPWRPADSLVWAKLMALGLDGNWRAELLRLRLSQKIGEDGVKFLIEPPGDSKDSTLSMVLAAVKDIDLDRHLPRHRQRGDAQARGLERVGAVGRPCGVGPAAARQRPASRLLLPRRLVPRPPGRAGLRHPRRHLARLARRRAGPQRHHRLGLHDHQPRQPGRLRRAGRSHRSQPLHHARRRPPLRGARRDHQRRLGRSDHDARARDAARPGDRRLRPPRRRTSRRRATCWPCRRRRSTAPIPRRKASAASGSAQNWEEFLAAARRIVSPMQNMVYADTSGNIGLISPARVPIRRKGDGSMPVPGWTSEYDWAGFVPFDELPRVYNPLGGLIVNANGRLVPDDYRHFISKDWAEPYRQRRAAQLLGEVERHPVYGMIVMQADNLTLDAAEMLPYLLKGAPRNARAAQARDLLSRWNMFMLASRPEPLIYDAWIAELQRGLLADELGEDLYNSIAVPNVPLMVRILRDKPGWCDDGGTKQTETCEDAIALALDRALDWIARRNGPDMTKWQWGREHFAVHRHPLFDGVPLLRDIASVRYPVGRRQPDAEPRRALVPRQPAVRCRARRRLSRHLRFQRSREQPLRHAARPVGQHALAVGAQLRRALAEARLHQHRRHPRRNRAQRRRHDHARRQPATR